MNILKTFSIILLILLSIANNYVCLVLIILLGTYIICNDIKKVKGN